MRSRIPFFNNEADVEKKFISRVQGGNNKGERTIAPFFKKKKVPSSLFPFVPQTM